MSRNGRIALAAGAVVVAVVAFVVLRPSDDDDNDSGDTPAAQTSTAPGDTTAAPPPKPEPRVDKIVVKQGKPVGGVQDLTWEKGDTIRLEVRSDEAHEVHLHGYDVSKEVTAGGVAKFKFDATLDGIYEMELEDLAEPIAELKVEP